MTRLSFVLATAVVLLIVGVPLIYSRQRHETYRNFRVVEEGLFYRSGQMSPAGMEYICREKGIKTVISLRDEDKQSDDVDDEEAACRASGVQVYETIPPKGWEEEGGVVPMEENLRRFAERLDETTVDPETGERRPTYPRPILIHCFAGIHRTGSHVAVYRVKYNGYTPAEAIAEMKDCGKSTTTYVGNLIPFLRDRHLPAVYEEANRRAVGDGGE